MIESEDRKRFHILIVEDDRPLADGLCRALQNENTETVDCHTLREADRLLGETGFDLVVLDVNLPDGNGFDFLQKIKAKCDVCVIMLTANDLEADIVAGLELGADDYITKPFSLAVLRARVETQLRRVAAQREMAGGDTATVMAAGMPAMGVSAAGRVNGGMAAFRVTDGSTEGGVPDFPGEGWIVDGAYRFHFAKMLFFHDGEQVELSKVEQRLLRLLVENKHATLTREQLLDFTWSVDAEFVDENTLSVAVKRLRDKLGAQDKIKTVYGIGYRWE